MDDSKTMSTDAVPKEYVTRVNQVYRAYLTTTYNIDYYHEKYVRLANQTKHLDFLIALGAAASGGSGLGILAATEFAWACGVLTTISTVGAIAKGNYDWSGRLRKCFEIIEFITPINRRYQHLVEDIQASRSWNSSVDDTYKTLRNDLANMPIDSSKELPIKAQHKIQDSIQSRLKYTSWWEWQDS